MALSIEETVEGLLKYTSPLPSKKEIKHSGSVVKQRIRNINEEGLGEKHPPYSPLKGGIPKAESEGSNQELSLQENNSFEQGAKSKETKKTTPFMPPQHLDKHNTQGEFKFPKQERLKSKKIIERLFAEGKSINAFPLKLIYLKTVLPEDVPIQVAVVAPKKHFKSAVKRNRIKRLLREAYRLNKASIFNNTKGQFALVILYLGKEMPTYSKIEVGTKALLTKFLKQISHEKTG